MKSYRSNPSKREYDRKRNRELYYERKRTGLCTKCGGFKENKDITKCKECYTKNIKYVKRWLVNNKEYHFKYRKTHKEYFKMKLLEFYERNPNYTREYKRQIVIKNKYATK